MCKLNANAVHWLFYNITPSVGKEKQKIMRHKKMSCDQTDFEHGVGKWHLVGCRNISFGTSCGKV